MDDQNKMTTETKPRAKMMTFGTSTGKQGVLGYMMIIGTEFHKLFGRSARCGAFTCSIRSTVSSTP
jgi:hypothetical protein